MLLLYNSKLENHTPDKTALAINDGKIFAVGSDVEILNLDAPGVEKFNLHGRNILPGLTDSHIHLDLYGQSLRNLNCSSLTKQDCLVLAYNACQMQDPGSWILGHGWNHNQWCDGYGTASELDTVSPNHPVFLTDVSLHSAWVNTKALELAGIDSSTPDPAGGTIQRDNQNKPTGILLEKAVDLVESKIPQNTIDNVKHNLLAAQERLLKYGITSVHDFDRIPCFKALQQLDEEQMLVLRVHKSLPVDFLNESVVIGLRTGFGSPHLRVGSIKLFADGALGPQTAAMLAPYENSDNYGKLLLGSEDIFEIGSQAAKSGLSLAVHAIGDLATQETLQGFAKLRRYEKENLLPALRHRIEHLQLLPSESISLAAELNICCSMQPVHLYMDMQTADKQWGSRSRFAFAFRSLVSQGSAIIFGSDAPVENPNPFWGIHAAVTRSGQGSNTAWYPEECINLATAINAYTRAPSRQTGVLDVVGDLAPGLLADLVVINNDPYQVKPDELFSLKPELVLVDGQQVYREI